PLWLTGWTLPDALFAGFIMAVAAMGLLEYFPMALPRKAVERTAGLVWGLVIAGGVAAQEPKLWGAGLGLAVIGGLMFPLLHADDLPGAMHRLGLSLLGVLYVGFFTPHFVLLHAQGWRWVLFTVYVAMGSDSGGYFAGRAFGRHPLAPAISPSKTVEGALGALAGAMVIAAVCRLVFFAGLGVLEAHELGHFAVAKQLGVLVERFSIGFGPVILARKRGETEYAVSAIPLGGYVKMLGDEEGEEALANPERAFSTQSVLRRAAIVFAGP